MFKVMRIIFIKEARDLWRDRRTLAYLFAVPILLPVFSAALGGFVLWQFALQTRDGLPVAIVNGEQMPEVIADLSDSKRIRLVDAPPDIEAALQNGDLAAVLEIPPDAAARLTAEQPVTLTLTSSRSGWLPDVALEAVGSAIYSYEYRLVGERLAGRGLDRTWLNPIRTNWEASAPVGVAVTPPVEEGGFFSSMMGSMFVIMLVVSWIFSGGLNVMSDMTIGEKERHTMEPLLVTPANRVGVVLGKIAIAMLVSILTVALWSVYAVGYTLLLTWMPTTVSGGLTLPSFVKNVGPALFWLVLLMLPLMLTVNALVAAISTFAKNYRESNLFLGILQLALPGVGMIAAFAVGAKPSAATHLTPLLGVLTAIRDLFGGGITPARLALVWVGAVVYAVLAVLLAAYVFSRERAIMRGM